MGNTTHLYRFDGSLWALANKVYFWTGTAWQAASRIWRWDPTNKWVMVYSTPAPVCPTVTGTNSGLAVSGTVTSSPAVTSIGGGFSGSAAYVWAYLSGDAGILCSDSAASNPTWTKTAVPAGTVSAIWTLTITDTVTGATAAINVSIQLTWINTESPISVAPINGSGAITVASGPVSGTVSTGSGGPAAGCSPSGGSGVYVSFAWSFFSGDSGIGINNSGIQNPTWSKFLSAPAGSSSSTSATWQVIVTDSEGHTTSTRITVSLSATSNQSPLTIGSVVAAVGGFDVGFDPSGHACGDVNTTESSTNIPGQTGGVFPSGGNGSYTYSWARLSGNTGISILSGASTQGPIFHGFVCTNTGAVTTIEAVWRCTVFDTSGQGPIFADMSVSVGIYLAND